MKPIVLIPARMASTRLPDKPLALIGGLPMIVQVWRRAMESAKIAQVADVVVACDGEAIAHVIKEAGGRAVITDPDLPSGSDRIHQALTRLDPQQHYDTVINLQGDMPTFDPSLVSRILALLATPKVDIATLAAPIREDRERTDPAVVKPAIAFHDGGKQGKALYFSRSSIPHGEGTLYHHIGLYGYHRHTLQQFVTLPPSPLEKREKLEQLRALEAGMHIEIAIVDTVPLGVDTPETLEIARKYYESTGQ